LRRGKKFLAELARPNQKFPEAHRELIVSEELTICQTKSGFFFWFIFFLTQQKESELGEKQKPTKKIGF